jgi:hypothetical protein
MNLLLGRAGWGQLCLGSTWLLLGWTQGGSWSHLRVTLLRCCTSETQGQSALPQPIQAFCFSPKTAVSSNAPV